MTGPLTWLLLLDGRRLELPPKPPADLDKLEIARLRAALQHIISTAEDALGPPP
jgi:hypothetical protein